MGQGVRRLIERRIRERGPMPFDEFMELALYTPGGYYDEPPIGSDRDFVTSPHVHWWFAYAISVALGALQEPLRTARTKLVELGAGDGTLARQLLEILAGAGPIDYVAVERSVGAKAALTDLGIDVRASVEELGPLEGCLVFANELLDNLPFRRIRRRSDGTLTEVCIGLRGDRLTECETDADATLAAFAPALGCGVETVVPTGALALVEALADQMRDSYALFIDYSTERGGEVHGYRRQHVVEDVLQRPGSSDVTAAVNFDAVEGHARTSGLAVLGRVTQRAALLSLGFAAWAEGERERARVVSAPDATRAWAARSRASVLVEPSGLGAHRWTLLATPGLPAPRWLEAALRS